MRQRFLSKKGLAPAVLGLCLLAWASSGTAAISIGAPLHVRILYDHSGSMHPGYKPPGTPGRKTRSELGVKSFHEYPEFQRWLGDFVARQTILDGDTVGMWTFTSNGPFSAGDIQPVHPELPIAQFDVSKAIANFPRVEGQNTYLMETLDHFTGDPPFEGLVWLITDNIVETRAGEPDVDVVKFFESLTNERYRSVHLFKYPFEDKGQNSALAVYGILVSAADVPDPVLAYYDRKFRSTFLFAVCRQGDPPPPLFPQREHLKLKNLRVDAMTVPALKVILKDHEHGEVFREGQAVQLDLTAEIKSNLTQHSVTACTYQLELSTPFTPEEWARRDLGALPLAPNVFTAARGNIKDTIPPEGRRELETMRLRSLPISFASRGLAAWVGLAFNPAVIKYDGTVRMSFQDVKVHLERAQMAGIFGIDKASTVFDFQGFDTLDVNPSEAPVTFALKTGLSRTALLLLLMAVLVAMLTLLWALLGRKRWYRVRISGTPDRIVALRRMSSYAVVHEGQTLGRLSRGILGDHEFAPNTNSAAFTINAGRLPDTWDVRFRDGSGCQLSVEPRDGSVNRPTRGDRGPSTLERDDGHVQRLPVIDPPV